MALFGGFASTASTMVCGRSEVPLKRSEERSAFRISSSLETTSWALGLCSGSTYVQSATTRESRGPGSYCVDQPRRLTVPLSAVGCKRLLGGNLLPNSGLGLKLRALAKGTSVMLGVLQWPRSRRQERVSRPHHRPTCRGGGASKTVLAHVLPPNEPHEARARRHIIAQAPGHDGSIWRFFGGLG